MRSVATLAVANSGACETDTNSIERIVLALQELPWKPVTIAATQAPVQGAPTGGANWLHGIWSLNTRTLWATAKSTFTGSTGLSRHQEETHYLTVRSIIPWE